MDGFFQPAMMQNTLLHWFLTNKTKTNSVPVLHVVHGVLDFPLGQQVPKMLVQIITNKSTSVIPRVINDWLQFSNLIQ